MLFPARSAALLALAALIVSTPAVAADASPWVQGFHSRVRLVAAGESGGARLAGLAIELDRGFKTYWRHPGESGLPPVFDWSRSANVADVEVQWPAPARFEDAGGVSYGYQEKVVLPLRVKLADARKPAKLALSLAYGVCKDICIPGRAEIALDLDKGSGAHKDLVAKALERVPARQAPNPAAFPKDGPAILALEPASGRTSFRVRVRADAKPQLFVEAPDGWYLAPASEARPTGDGASAFEVEVAERPSKASGPVELRLTLVDGTRAVETTLRLDMPPPAR